MKTEKFQEQNAEFEACRKELDRLRGDTRELDLAFETTLKAVPAGIGLVKDRVLIWINEQMTAMTGYAERELIGKSSRILYASGKEFERVGKIKYGQIELTGIGSIETRWRKRDGSEIDVYLQTRALKVGRPTEAIFTAMDITEKKFLENELRKNQERLQMAFMAAHEAIWDWNPSTKDFIVNETFKDLFGIPPKNKACRSWWLEKTHPEDRDRIFSEFRRACASGAQSHACEYRFRKRDESYGFIFNRMLFSRAGNGSVRRIVGAVLDITELKQSEADLKKKSLLLQDSVQELESFSYSVAHDFRAPLRAIDGFTGMILDDFGDRMEEDLKAKFRKIRQNTGRMNRLIDDLLAISRLQRHVPSRKRVDMEQLFHEAWSELVPVYPGRALEFHIQALPPSTGDPVMLKQLATNLLSNAIKFTQNSRPGIINIGSRTEGGQPVYHIRDNGVGFDMRFKDKLFQVFQRLHSPSEFEGTGIGLAIAERIVRKHGGRIWAEGKIDKGATFYFSLSRESEPPDRQKRQTASGRRG
ncbi:MAG TPA: PAS domain S-box protein [Syntrophales bacterium]|nr:PAS domain S-box protein [Syntrophales bacterium]